MVIVEELPINPQEVIYFATEIDAVTPEGLICARIAGEMDPLGEYETLLTEDELYDAIEDIEEEDDEIEETGRVKEPNEDDEDDEWE